jgi:hypothetical protein
MKSATFLFGLIWNFQLMKLNLTLIQVVTIMSYLYEG